MEDGPCPGAPPQRGRSRRERARGRPEDPAKEEAEEALNEIEQEVCDREEIANYSPYTDYDPSDVGS